jgi:hypothetical protein
MVCGSGWCVVCVLCVAAWMVCVWMEVAGNSGVVNYLLPLLHPLLLIPGRTQTTNLQRCHAQVIAYEAARIHGQKSGSSAADTNRDRLLPYWQIRHAHHALPDPSAEQKARCGGGGDGGDEMMGLELSEDVLDPQVGVRVCSVGLMCWIRTRECAMCSKRVHR